MKLAVLFLCILMIGLVGADQCKDVYFWILSHGYNYTPKQLNDSGFSEDMIYNYSENCYNSTYKNLPQRPEQFFYVSQKIDVSCDHSSDSYFIPLPEIGVGNRSCDFIQHIKNFFQIQKNENVYSIVGLNISIPIIIICMGIFFYFVYHIIKIRKILQKNDR